MKYTPIVGLACILGLGCQLFEDRRNPSAEPTTYAPLPAELPADTATAEPAPERVSPPSPTGWAENIPSLPESNIPQVEVRPPTSSMVSTSASETGPIREILAEGRRRRMDRREERRAENTPEPVRPTPPTTPPQPITPPPLPATMPSLGAPLEAVAPPVANPAEAILAKSNTQYAKLKDYEARFIKREVVKGKPLPQDEMIYRFRKEPLSVYMKILSEEGKGREVMYVKGQFDNDMHVITGKGDTFLGTGIKTTVEPDSRQAAAKSRRRIYEAGFGRTLTQLQQSLSQVKALGPVKRAEWSYPLDGLELAVAPNSEPDMPQGGVRRYYFDPNEQSPSYMLPVLITTTDAQGKEIEYYSFTQFKVPSGMSDADWNPATMGK